MDHGREPPRSPAKADRLIGEVRVLDGPGAGKMFAVREDAVVGRDDSADIVIADDSGKISRRHLRIRYRSGGEFVVEDLESTNGTFLNGERVYGAHPLRDGDQIRLGTTMIEFVPAPDVATRPRQLPDQATRPRQVPDQATRPRQVPDQATRPRRQPELVRTRHVAPTEPESERAVTVAEPPARQPQQAPDKPPPAPAAPNQGVFARWRDVRGQRAALPAFPNYTQIPSLLSIPAWWAVRATGLVATVAEIVILIAAPTTGLKIMWGVAIPLLPIMFFVAPGLWRNICPLAASNQTPRVMGWTRALEAPAWFKRYGYLISITLFVAFITLRKVGLQTNGLLSGLLLVAALTSAFTGGMFLKGKSGWCSSICPLLPVQRIYGQTPFALIGNSHCQPCVGCTKNCYDFNPRPAYLADLNDSDPRWTAGRKFFIAAFPGLVLGFFEVKDVPVISAASMYGQLALYAGASIGIFFLVDSFSPFSTHKLTTLYAATALNIFYWFAVPTIVRSLTGSHSPAGLTWSLRAVLFVLTATWIVRTYRKEEVFAQRGAAPREGAGAVSRALSLAGGRALSLAGSRSLGAHSAANLGKPEVTFLPDGKRIVAEQGKTVLEVAEANGMPIEAGCRMGVCGADPIAVVNGMPNLSEIDDDERATLERLGLAENTRMACCCRINGSVLVSLAPEQAGRMTQSQILRMNFDRTIQKVVVIGNGIAGITAADYVRRNHPECAIDVVAEEAHHLYNRMAITRLIYGRSAMQGLYLNPETWAESRDITLWLNTRALSIDREACQVRLGTGEELRYDRLILATGSASFVPSIEGWGAPGTFVLRSADDALQIRAFVQAHQIRTAVVAGGGLLGLEAAFALHKLGLATTVLEVGGRLLRRQLDEPASELLQRCIEGLGISVETNTKVCGVAQNGRLREVVLEDGRTLPAELLIVAAGIAPKVELAREAGLETAQGVLVDEHMRTSDERIFAAGDVAQFGSHISGLWPTAVEQARVAAEAAVLQATTPYKGTLPVTVLKVSGIELTSIGQIDAATEAIVQEDVDALRYGKLVLSEGRIVGAILLGYSREVAPITSAVKQGWDITPILDDLRAGRWEAVEGLTRGRSLSSVSVVGLGAA